MNLEQLKQEAESLQNIDTTSFSPEQLNELIQKLSSILEQSEQSLLQSTLTEIKENESDNS